MTAGEVRSRRIELACFAALAAMAALQWTALVSEPPEGRVLIAVALVTAAGAAVATGGRTLSARDRWALGALATIAAVALGLVVVGLPARLLEPAHWGELASNVGASVDGLGDVPVPYAGADPWTRLVILLAAPLIVGLAALAAFWPTRHRAAGRICALVLLVGLYLSAIAWAQPDRQLAGGLLLLLLICAWLWLPGVAAGNRAAATIAVIAAAAVALPAAASIDPGRALIDYRHWGLLSANGVSFRWDQSYGPLSWPQKGTLLLEVASDGAHYWKATDLDSFDGTRWVRSTSYAGDPVLGQPRAFHPKREQPQPDPRWTNRINLDVRKLNSSFAVGAGTVLSLHGIDAQPTPDGAWKTSRELRPGEEYTALVYDPQPSVAEMRAAGTAYPDGTQRYVSFSLAGGPSGFRSIQAPYWSASGPASISSQVSGTPYEGMYALARQVTVGAATPYAAARRIERFLRTHYAYRQDVPSHAYPLPAFLSGDRAGYCQQFSGSMALMLRMLGVPSRVAAGFSPGGRDPERNTFLVDDTDAHDWVEVFFPGIGWVTFDPTPPTAPAATQQTDNALGVTKPGPKTSVSDFPAALPDRGDGTPQVTESNGAPQAHPTKSSGSGPGAAILGGVVLAVAALVALGLYAVRVRRRRRLDHDCLERAELAELERALGTVGVPLPPGATLARAEHELERSAGPGAAHYAAALMDRRFRDPGAPPPGVGERRALRRALIRAAGRRSAIRVWRTIPPGGPSPRRADG